MEHNTCQDVGRLYETGESRRFANVLTGMQAANAPKSSARRLKKAAVILCRVCGGLFGVWLLVVSFGMSVVAYELNQWRISQTRIEATEHEVVYSEHGYPIIGGSDGPTTMWMSVGGKTIYIEPKASHILAHVGIAVLSGVLGAGLLFVCLKRRKA